MMKQLNQLEKNVKIMTDQLLKALEGVYARNKELVREIGEKDRLIKKLRTQIKRQ